MKTVESLTTALQELLGFAERNFKRATAALEAADHKRGPSPTPDADRRHRIECAARAHEAARFYMVVRDRVAEALR